MLTGISEIPSYVAYSVIHMWKKEDRDEKKDIER